MRSARPAAQTNAPPAVGDTHLHHRKAIFDLVALMGEHIPDIYSIPSDDVEAPQVAIKEGRLHQQMKLALQEYFKAEDEAKFKLKPGVFQDLTAEDDD
jgi:hypothetical protein